MKISASTFHILMISFLLVACLPVSTPAPGINVPTTLPMPEILPTPSATVPLDTRSLATLNIAEHPLATAGMIGNHPDEIVYAGGFVWTKTANGHVVQVDPATNKMVGAIKVDTATGLDHYCQGLGTNGEDVWACSASSDEENTAIYIVRINTQTQSIVETIKVRKLFDQFKMPFLSNQIWVLAGNGDKLIGIDVNTNQPGPAIDLGTRCFQLAVTDDALLATCALDDLVLQIDPVSREVTARVSLESPVNISATRNAIWVTQDNAIVRLDPESLHPVAIFSNLPGLGSMGDIYATEAAVWVRQESGFLYRIDPSTNQIVEQILPNEKLTGGSVLVTSDSIWTTAIDDNLLIRLSLHE